MLDKPNHIDSLRQNALLASLPSAALEHLLPIARTRTFAICSVVYDAGQEIAEILFPITGFAAMQTRLQSGAMVDTAWIGSAGALGNMAGTGGYRSASRCFARSPLRAFGIPAADYQRLAAKHGALRDLCLKFNDALLAQTQVNAARFATLKLETRFALCLLETAALLGTPDSVALRQSDLAEMLSVRRSSISEVNGTLENLGIIWNLRGRIAIRDQAKLLRFSGESHAPAVARAPTPTGRPAKYIERDRRILAASTETPPRSLESIGDEFGLTGTRIRQIIDTFPRNDD